MARNWRLANTRINISCSRRVNRKCHTHEIKIFTGENGDTSFVIGVGFIKKLKTWAKE